MAPVDDALDRLAEACTGWPQPNTYDDALATVRDHIASQEQERLMRAIEDAEAAEAEVQRLTERLRDQVKFCPYCAGAFVPESLTYEGPCEGCKIAERLREERDALRRDGLADLTETARRLDKANALLVEIARWSRVAVLNGDLHARIASSLAETSVPGSCAADVDGADETVGHHESVGERQGRQPGTEDEWEELPEQRLRGYISAEGSHSMLPYLDKLVRRAEAAEAEVQRYREGLREIEQQQPKTIAWMRANGIVFDGPLGTDPQNWQHIAFSIYSDLCKTDAMARALLADSQDGGVSPLDSDGDDPMWRINPLPDGGGAK